MILVDSNVPMYLVGTDARLKADAQLVLERLALERARLVTDVEVYQEILHRYRAIGRDDMIQPAFDLLSAIVDDVLDVSFADVDGARDVLLGNPRISARDALHVSVMRRHQIRRVLSFDRGFDAVAGVERVV
jgi:predicted nucleic acid-binding protein